MTKVAIVEDSRASREGLEMIVNLAPGHHCVCTCANAEDALKVLPRHEPDIVLMDIQLPKMSGIECAEQLKQVLPSAHVIMVTVYEDPDRIFSALRAGASGYLLKRATPEQIHAALLHLREGGVPMSAEIARKVIGYFRNQETVTAEVDGLTTREREVLELVAQGFSNKDIAARLFVTVEAIRWHLKRIYHKLHVHSRTEAALKLRAHK